MTVDDTPLRFRWVAALIARNLPPAPIRQAILTMMQPFRHTFINLIQDIYDQTGYQRCFQTNGRRYLFINGVFVVGYRVYQMAARVEKFMNSIGI